MTLSVASTFAGIEGMGLAAERNGMRVAWQSEINPDASAVLAHHYPNVPNHGDITMIKGEKVEHVDLLCGGFPCQDLSVAGRRAGLAGERSGLFYDFARLVGEIWPSWIVLENVPGLLSSNRGRDMGIVVGTLADLRYGVAWRVLDAQNFGVPQRRRRVVIVGHLGNGTAAGQVLFKPESGGRDSAQGAQSGARIAGTLAASAGSGGVYGGVGQSANSITSRIVETPSIASTLQGGGNRGYRIDAEAAAGGHLIPARVVPALTTRAGNTQDDQQTGQLVAVPVALRGRDGGATAELGDEPISNALRASTGGGDKAHVLTASAVRRLTPTECERLQGFPDGWTDVPNAKGKPMSDSARYRMLGNAVAVPVFEWVFGRLARIDACRKLDDRYAFLRNKEQQS